MAESGVQSAPRVLDRSNPVAVHVVTYRRQLYLKVIRMTSQPVNIFGYEELAKERISKGDYDFIAGGATDEITIRRTRAVLTPS